MDEVKITGVEQVKRNMETWIARKIEKAKGAYKETGLRIETMAKAACPVKTNRLRSSINTNWTGSGMQEGRMGSQAKPGDGLAEPDTPPGMFIVVTGTNVKYGPYVEFGTSRQMAQPYLYQAFFAHEGRAEKAVERVLQEDERLA